MLKRLLVGGLLALVGCTERSEVQLAADPANTAQSARNPCAESSGFAAYACAKPDWRQRDNELNRMLARIQAGAGHSAKADLRNAQKRWEITRDACLEGPRPEREPCLESLYSSRMNALTDLLD